jgi:hypothetical protein
VPNERASSGVENPLSTTEELKKSSLEGENGTTSSPKLDGFDQNIFIPAGKNDQKGHGLVMAFLSFIINILTSSQNAITWCQEIDASALAHSSLVPISRLHYLW